MDTAKREQDCLLVHFDTRQKYKRIAKALAWFPKFEPFSPFKRTLWSCSVDCDWIKIYFSRNSLQFGLCEKS